MNPWLAFLIGMWLGVGVGIFVAALLRAAKDRDRVDPQPYDPHVGRNWFLTHGRPLPDDYFLPVRRGPYDWANE